MFSSFGASSAAGQFVKRKPLVRFEASEKATIVSESETATPSLQKKKRSPSSSEAGTEEIYRKEVQPKQVRLEISSMAKLRKSRKGSGTRMVQVRSSARSRVKRKRGKRVGGGGSSSNKKPRMVKGRLQIRVGGYTGVQKIPPSALMKYLPTIKLKAAAKKHLSQSVAAKRTRPASRKKRRSRRKRTTK